MDISMLDGFLTAVTIGPTLILPSECLPMVWGASGEEPDFESADEANRILGLLLRLHNQNIRTLTETPEEFAPLLCEVERGGKRYLSGEEWCTGFGLGMGLRAQDWSPLLEDDEARELLLPVMWLSSEEVRKEMGDAGDAKAAQSAMLDLLGLSVVGIYAYWEPYRQGRPAGTRTETFPMGRKPRIGRNHPCPCGSAKKYKKCCGATSA